MFKEVIFIFFIVEDVAELNRRFTSQRATLPHMYLVTPYDLRPAPRTDAGASLDQRYKQASLWTKGSVSLQILYRSKQLAAAAIAYLNNNILSNCMDVKVMNMSCLMKIHYYESFWH